MANSHGETDWTDGSSGGDSKGNNKDLYLHLENGSNFVRALTKPHKYMCHKGVKKVGDQGYGRKFPCSEEIEKGSCPLCKLGFKPQTRYLLGVLDRRSNAYKVLDISYGVFQDIKKYNAKPMWGDPSKYDIDLVVDKDAAPAKYYTVQAVPHSPLSAAEQSMRDKADLEYLKKRVEPINGEVIQKFVNIYLGDNGQLELPKPKKEAQPVKAKSVPDMVDTNNDNNSDDSENLGDFFPPANA